MQQIKKRQQKRQQSRKLKQNKLQQQLTQSTINAYQSIVRINDLSEVDTQQQKLQIDNIKKSINPQKQLPVIAEEKTFLIKNLDENEYETLTEKELEKVQQKLNYKYEKIQSLETFKDEIWNSYQNNLTKAEQRYFQACVNGDLVALDRILQGKSQYPININCLSEENKNCLHITIINSQNIDILRRLIYKGADLNQSTTQGRTPLILAVIKGIQDIVKLLIQFKCDLDLQDKYGNTALHYACLYNFYTIAEILLINKANPNIQNKQTQTADDLCTDIRILELFEKRSNNSTDYTRTIYDDKIFKNSRIDHVQKILNLTSNKIAISNQKSGTQDQGNNQETAITTMKKKKIFKRYQLMSQVINKEIKQISLINFKQIDLLGKGSFGYVLLVENQLTKKRYAMKILDKIQILKQKLLKYAIIQRKILSMIKNPFVVKLHYAFQTAQKLILVIDYCPGGDLMQLIKKYRTLQEKLIKKYVAEIILAIQCLHKAEIIYRDLKPANIVIDSQGHACLTDFGLSKQASTSHSFCGSIAYLAPQMLTRRGHTRTLDWYLLGVLIYECFTGKPPFWDMNKQKLMTNIKIGRFKPLGSNASQQMKDIVQKLLKSNPSKRLGNNGAEEIQKHPWFNDIDWKQVYARKLQMPTFVNYNSITSINEPKIQIFSAHDIELSKTVNRIEQWDFKT